MERVAIVGYGRMGAEHARAWRAVGAEVAAVVDRAGGRAAADGVPVRPLEDVLADPAVPLLSICTPTDTHLALTERALDAGKHVLLEKPLARTVAEGEALVRLADRGPGVLMVAHVVRFFPGYVALRDVVAAGRIGAPREARAQRLSASGGRPPWLDDEARSGGILLDLAVHDFDQLLLVLGPALAVTAERAPDGTVAVAVEHEGGRTGHARVGWDLPVGTPFTTVLDVEGDAGRATYTFQGEPADRSELAVEDAGGRRLEQVPPGDPYAAQAAAFLAAVRAGTSPRHGNAADSLAALRLALAARTSLLEGRRVALAEAGQPSSDRTPAGSADSGTV